MTTTIDTLDSSAVELRTPEGFRNWRVQHGLSQKALAALLELDEKGAISRYENGHSRIPRTVELALRWLDLELAQRPAPPVEPREWTPAEKLALDLCVESSDLLGDVEVTVAAFIRTYGIEDLEAAVTGNKHAMIRLRKACGLPAFK